MPTPESEAFLAKKPKVPPTFDGVDFADNQAVTDARDAIVREQWVGMMMQRLVGEEMGTCDSQRCPFRSTEAQKHRKRRVRRWCTNEDYRLGRLFGR